MPSPTEISRFTASRVRRDFLDFFTKHGHREVPSAPVFPSDDPTLLFTNAGMNQFKDVFLGTGSREYLRAVDTQKCIRVSGKHNDLEEVGRDTYHHTFFEMLGNWSFGDYFKEEAILWAWELLTGVWGLPKERLWVTVFAGDEGDGLAVDAEAEAIWLEKTDIDPSHVLRCDKTDNFWEMGATGPCGPCSEIHIDRGGPGSNPTDGADPKIGVNAGNERFIELWNLVFMQFNRLDDGTLVKLPKGCVDTGMGFERILSVLQGKNSNYDTDLFQPIFRRLEELSGKKYEGGDEEVDVAFRVCADHIRATSCAFADGALPSNEGRGYVLRRLIRRASRFGRQVLGLSDPFLFELVPTVSEIIGDAFPELSSRLDHVQLLVRSEEEAFGKTLDRGLVLFSQLAAEVEGAGGKQLEGGRAFELYATFGFPRDLVELMARERGMALDEAGWKDAAEAHRQISRSEGSFQQLLSAEQLTGLPETQSTYHEGDARSTENTGKIAGFWQAEGRPDRLVLDVTPFYGESGGQVGDKGLLRDEGGRFEFRVEDTQRVGPIVVHIGSASGVAEVGMSVTATVDKDRRDAIRANHTGTHLLHKALREVLGDHVTQQGSYVGPDRLRFDLSNPKGISPEQLLEVETIVNRQIMSGKTVATTVERTADAMKRGVTALFGEKYGDEVRVVDVEGWSTELCGGTHVRHSGDIGPFVIISERAIQAGVRRIEALTHANALDHIQTQRGYLMQAAGMLKTKPEEVPERLDALQKQVKEAKKAQKKSAGEGIGEAFDAVKAALKDCGGVSSSVVDLPGLDGAGLRGLGERLKGLGGDTAIAIFGRDSGKVPFIVICLGAAQEKGLAAGKVAKSVAGLLGGGGGGKPDLAQGQGTKVDQIEAALEAARSTFKAALGG
ncbi:MAG: alanyl-tRNA synthetase [Planctomycetota bacterium]|jgi:alanyl-tRNA synthetase